MLKEISKERLEILGKLKDNEVDLSKTELVTKEKAQYLCNVVLGDVFKKNVAAFLT